MKIRNDYITNSSSSSYIISMRDSTKIEDIKQCLLNKLSKDDYQEIVYAIDYELFGEDEVTHDVRKCNNEEDVIDILAFYLYQYIKKQDILYSFNGYTLYIVDIDSGAHGVIENIPVITGTIGEFGFNIVRL